MYLDMCIWDQLKSSYQQKYHSAYLLNIMKIKQAIVGIFSFNHVHRYPVIIIYFCLSMKCNWLEMKVSDFRGTPKHNITECAVGEATEISDPHQRHVCIFSLLEIVK